MSLQFEEKLGQLVINLLSKQVLRLVPWSIAVDYLVKATFGLAWAVAITQGDAMVIKR